MTVAEKRKILAAYLKKEADEKLVNMIYALVQEYVRPPELKFKLSDAQFKALEKDRKAYLAGKGKTYSLEEVNKMMMRKFKKSRKKTGSGSV